MRNSQSLHRLLVPIVLSLLSLVVCPASASSGSDYDYGAHPRFVCTPIPVDADPSCFPTAGPGGGEAKATILHLRESLVQQKETILDQRETIRELTHHGTSYSHHAGVAGGQRSDGGHSNNNHGKDKHVTPGDITSSPEQTERMLHALKERLENLQQKRNTSITYSSSLKELLQRKINALEQQLSRLQQLLNGPCVATALFRNDVMFFLQTGSSRKKSKSPDDFQISFPMRTNYMYGRVKRTLLQEIFALTLCLWMKAGAGPSLGTPFSYSAPGQANELVLIEWGNNPIELLIDDKAVTLPLSVSDGKWHHVCVTWSTRDGQWEAYQDGVQRGSGINLSPWHPIKPGGVFILGQEQDTLGGRFDATQSFVGEMSDVHMWSHVLSASDIYNLASCSSHLRGDVIAWSDTEVELHGGVARYPFDSCH
uniref:Neuronal pentraxin-1-like n=1 Tax=Seriola dumerili TaxID=41447 RepID=A0A3B4TYM2_SERDU